LTDVESLRRASQLLQATGLGYAVEADRRRFPRCSMVLPWQLNESYPNAWCTSSVDHSGAAKPAYHAVSRAFARRRVTVKTPTSAWGGDAKLSAEAWVWDEDGTGPGSTVTGRLRDAYGIVLGERCWTLDGPVDQPRAVGSLTVPAAGVPPDAVVVWDFEWMAADGTRLDRDAVLAGTGTDLAPLLDLPPAVLEITAHAGGVLVSHRSGPLVVGLQLLDERPGDTPGRRLIDGDPRPLLPGEQRRFQVTGTGALLLESWNTDPVRIESPTEESHR
jgi:beta-mannosidase